MFIVRIADENRPDIKCFEQLDAAKSYARAASIHGDTAVIYRVAEQKDVRRAVHEFQMEDCEVVLFLDPEPSASEIDAVMKMRARCETERVLNEIGFS